MTREVGLAFVHRNGAAGHFFIPEIIGAGVAMADLDADGDLDVVLVQGGGGGREDGRTGGREEVRHAVWRNDLVVAADGTRRLRFTEVTDEAGLVGGGHGMGVATGDYDGDGLVDLYITALGANALYRNLGGLRFENVTGRAGVDDPRWSTSAAFADVDGDGHLDLFVTNYLDFSEATSKPCFEPAGSQDYCPPTRYRPVPDRLFHNRGDGTFEDVSERAGVTRAFGNGLGVAVADYDGDRRPDIYVANDATPNQLWQNLGNGRFEDLGPLSGAAFSALGRPEGSMGIAAADIDHDGDADLVVTNIVGETFVLYRNDGAGGFDDERVTSGLARATSEMTGFGGAWLDADNDGVLDLVIANGAVNVLAGLRGTDNPYRQRNQIFRGVLQATDDDDGAARRRPGHLRSFRLEELTGATAGQAFDQLEVSRGLAVGDLDNDGGPDVLITNNGGPARLLRNALGGDQAWVGLDLRDASNAPAIGALVAIGSGPATGRLMRIRTDGSYLSASDPRVLVGLGPAGRPLDVTITWPNGTVQQVQALVPGRYHRLDHARP